MSEVIVTYNGYYLRFVLTLPSFTEPCIFAMTPRSTLDDFRAMMIAEDNLIQKISFMSEDGEFRLAKCTSLESIETRKFRMRINETEFHIGLPKETQFTSADDYMNEIQKLREELQVVKQIKSSICLKEDLKLQKLREELQVAKQIESSICVREDLVLQKLREELQVAKQIESSICLREDLELQKLREQLQVVEQIKSSICLGKDLEIQKLREELQVAKQIESSICLGEHLEMQKLREELQVFNQIKTSTCLPPEYLGGLKQRLLRIISDGRLDESMRSCSMNCNMQLGYYKHEIDVFTAAQLESCTECFNISNTRILN